MYGLQYISSMHLLRDVDEMEVLNPMKARKSFLLRLDPHLYRELEAWAAEELRSSNSQIEFILTEAVRKRGKKLTDQDFGQESDHTPNA